MKYTDTEIAEMRKRMAAIAIVAMLRFFKHNQPIGQNYKDDLLAELQISTAALTTWKRQGCPVIRGVELESFCQARSIPFYRHQFAPNSETVLSNLEYYLHLDQRFADIELRTFKYWDANLPLSVNRRADNANHNPTPTTKFLLEPVRA